MGGTGSKAAATTQPGSNGKGGGDSTPSKVGLSDFVIGNRGRLQDFYKLDGTKLGEGDYGVFKAVNKETSVPRALKSISKLKLKNIERFKQEFAINKIIDHPNLIKLHDSFEDRRNIYLLFEFCTGGELFGLIAETGGSFTEVHASILMKQIVSAIRYLHENHICHRDLKPENIILMKKAPIEQSVLKIIGFGLSCTFGDAEVLTTKSGTPYYVAPQVLAGAYDHRCDLWSCGVIIYVLLCGYPPFYADSDAEVLSKVRLGNVKFNVRDWKHVSEDATDLVRMLLKVNPRERYTAEQALNHVWIRNKAPQASRSSVFGQAICGNLKGFSTSNKLKTIALHIMDSQFDESAIKKLREAFVELDVNGGGKLTIAQMEEGMEKVGLRESFSDFLLIVEEVDPDRSGVIDYTEFLHATLDRQESRKEDIIRSAFRIFDIDGDGQISRDELSQVLADDSVVSLVGGADAVKALLDEVDANGDGVIDFDEFMEMMNGTDDHIEVLDADEMITPMKGTQGRNSTRSIRQSVA